MVHKQETKWAGAQWRHDDVIHNIRGLEKNLKPNQWVPQGHPRKSYSTQLQLETPDVLQKTSPIWRAVYLSSIKL